MKKEQALQLLNDRIHSLDSKDFNSDIWQDQTISIIDKIFKNSFEEKKEQIENIAFIIFFPGFNEYEKRTNMEKGKENAKKYLLGYINEINEFGIEKDNKIELPRKKNKVISWGLVVAIITVTNVFSYNHGRYKFDKEKENIYEQSISQQDSIRKLNNKIFNQDSIISILSNEIDLNNLKTDSISQ